MITCEKCGTEFVAHGRQAYPGGTDSPASHIAYAVIFGVAGVVCGIIGIFVFHTVMFALAIASIGGDLFSITAIPESLRICRQSGGGICPSCGCDNEVTWHS